MKSHWLAMLLLLIVAFAAVTGTGLLMQAGAEPAVVVDPGGWRYSGGYWNYYDPGDKAYYYTDGRHWYTYGDNNTWGVYNFDRGFGKAYVREGYIAPRAGADIVLPRHTIRVR